jgi:hypothetical protein
VAAKSSRRQVEAVVSRAIAVARQIRLLTSELEGLKARIREAGEAARIDDEKVEIASPDGTVVVTFPRDRIAVRDGQDPMVLRAILPADTWSKIFTMKISVGEEAEAIWDALRGEARRALDRVLAREPRTPQVILPR